MMYSMTFRRRVIRAAQPHVLLALLLLSGTPGVSWTQPSAPADSIHRINLSVGRSLPITTTNSVLKVAVANPDIATVVVVTEHDVLISGKALGETDVVLWETNRPRIHYRVSVRTPDDRRLVLLSVRLAEVRRDVLRQVGVSGLYTSKMGNTRVGTGAYKTEDGRDSQGSPQPPMETRFLSILSDFGTKQFLALLEAEEQSGRARLLAEPNLLAADRDSASFLAGGELPVPVVQGGGLTAGAGVQAPVTIQYREFGVRLRFAPNIVSDSVITLYVRPEVSSLDYSNAITLSGFRIPALRSRRVESSVDIRRDQSVILSGLFNDERERVRTGVPLLMNLPILGALFSSSRWQSSETELLVIVTPTIVDPAHLGDELTLPLLRDQRTPAIELLRKRLPADTTRRAP
ncbi:type II and III secretion system protein family protein [Gemmatimonas sp.]|jgi:Flp pilus assembly secretin CpaC|uniref:type II and III secretion system protein family protein n=1 Tax=Gemmatimonas sp. TaxID=1962908 RepID=UPI0037C002CB